MSQRNKQLIEQANQAIKANKTHRQEDPYRMHYHLMPPVGLLNDPNGFIHYKGMYHLFYQWNPFATEHGAKFWGHYTSPDLVDWTAEPIALAPSEPYEKDGCYSGSAIEHDGKMYLFYTGNVKNDRDEREAYQCLAISEDGYHFEKKGPIIHLPEGFTAHFRDPKVWKENGRFYMVIGAQDDEKRGCAVLYSAHTPEDWKYEGIIAGAERQNLGEFGYMWECPDLFHLEDKDILLVCPQGLEADGFKYNNIFQSGYFTGNFDKETATFNHEAFKELDHGFDFYAPQTTLDAKGRRILFGWMGITDESEPYQPTIKYDWIHAMTLPRELILKDNQIYQQPVEELKQLRKNEVSYQKVSLHNETRCFDEVSGRVLEISLSGFTTDELEEFSIDVRGEAQLSYHAADNVFKLKRKNFINGELEERACHVRSLDNLRIFLDTSSIEVFINDGEDVFTARIFPDSENEHMIFKTEGNIQFDLKKWDLGKK